MTSWQHESKATLQVFEKLTDTSLKQAVMPGGRTLGRLANHIIETLTEMPHRMGLGIAEENPAYSTVGELVSNYQRCSDQLIAAVKQHWTDSSLDDSVNMYGEPWTHRFSLSVLINHQIHHRAQMTVLMRQAGLAVPGIYGPSREEWEQMGMPAMQ